MAHPFSISSVHLTIEALRSLMQYFGYSNETLKIRLTPTSSIPISGNQSSISLMDVNAKNIKAFINAGEYRKRFGQS